MSAANTNGETVAVVVAGTPVPLPNNQILNNFTASGDGTTFTAASAGTYMISYDVKLTAPALLTSSVRINGTDIPASVVTPTDATDSYSKAFVVTLAENDEISLVLSNLLGAATLAAGSGANLVAVKIA
ncbi:hypothetical protein LJC42_06455 [Eubacteriales bacterium OttesenSCG-928-K08]|nr:hypothetical protein [Eubacteriales bacterium OttesenSCG-928-K08]